MIQNNLTPQAQNVGDGAAGAFALASILGVLPEILAAVASALAIIWTLTRLYEYAKEKLDARSKRLP